MNELEYYYKIIDKNEIPYGTCATGTEPHPNPPQNYVQIDHGEYLKIYDLLESKILRSNNEK